jgi:predicted dehydrogenase
MTPDNAADSTTKVALIGYGLAGRVFHAPLISATAGMQLSAVVTRDAEKAQSIQATYPTTEIIADAADIWKRSTDFDLVVIATPNSSHAPLAMAALEANLNVIVDKPMALNASDCQRLIDLSQSKDKLLTVFHNRRFDADFLTVQLLLRSNSLGAVNRFESRFDRWRPVPKEGAWRERGGIEDGAGLLFDLGSHLIDQALVLFGKPLSVYCEMNSRRPGISTDDDSFVALTFADGVRAHLWMSALVRKPAPRFRVCGMLGTFEKFGLDPQEDALRAGRLPNSSSWGAEPSELWGTISSEREGLHYEGRVETLRGDYPAFYRQLREAVLGEAIAPVDPAEALLTIQVIEAARRSAEIAEVVHFA